MKKTQVTVKDLVEHIFGVEASEDSDILDLYTSIVKDTLDSIRVEKHLPVDKIIPLPDCTRVEVVDVNGRAYYNMDMKTKVSLSVQDNNRTLKIFISKDGI